MGDLEAGADRLDGEVEGAVEVGGRRRHHDLVVGRPDRHPQRAGGRLVAGVELAEQLAVGEQLLARLGARVRGDVGAQTGQVGAVVRRADRDDPAGQAVAAVVARPEAGDDAAGGVPDHVDRPGAVPLHLEDHGLVERPGLLVEVAGVVTGQVDDHHRPPLRPQRVGQHLQRGGAAVVARHEQHRPLALLGHRPDRLVAVGPHRGADPDRRDQREHGEAEHEPPAGGGESLEHLPILALTS